MKTNAENKQTRMISDISAKTFKSRNFTVILNLKPVKKLI